MRLKFLRNTTYEGRDYGPDYEEAEAEVTKDWARRFIASGHAVVVRDPQPEHRDPGPPVTAPPRRARKRR